MYAGHLFHQPNEHFTLFVPLCHESNYIKMKKIVFSFAVVAMLMFISLRSFSHCEVPCGIYDDKLRIELIKEHITTIEKAMNQIKELESQDDLNYNQIVRWVTTKEMHAIEIQHIADQYFMTQRIKPVDPSEAEKYEKYITQLTLMHQLLIYAMKSKQTTDQEWIDKMRVATDKFEEAYFAGMEHKH
jgi:nickel superoxide dismutase